MIFLHLVTGELFHMGWLITGEISGSKGPQSSSTRAYIQQKDLHHAALAQINVTSCACSFAHGVSNGKIPLIFQRNNTWFRRMKRYFHLLPLNIRNLIYSRKVIKKQMNVFKYYIWDWGFLFQHFFLYWERYHSDKHN